MTVIEFKKIETLEGYRKSFKERFEEYSKKFTDGTLVDFLIDEHMYCQKILANIYLETVETEEDKKGYRLALGIPSGYEYLNLWNIENKEFDEVRFKNLKLSYKKIKDHVEKLLNAEGYFLEEDPLRLCQEWTKSEQVEDLSPEQTVRLKDKIWLLLETGIINHLVGKYDLLKNEKINCNKLAELVYPLLDKDVTTHRSIQPILNATLNNPEEPSEKNIYFKHQKIKTNTKNHLKKFL